MPVVPPHCFQFLSLISLTCLSSSHLYPSPPPSNFDLMLSPSVSNGGRHIITKTLEVAFVELHPL